MHLMYTPDGYVSERFSAFYYRRAEGGAALIFVGGCRFDEYGGSPGMLSLETDDFVPGLRTFTDEMHKRGAKVGVQLYHAGAYAHSIGNEGRQAIAPSDIFSRFTKEEAREMTVGELHTVIEKWAAALRAKKTGFDCVELSASAGYLICQFLSPKTNERTDAYGGSWKNRTRFARELLIAVRGAVGDDYPVCVRIAGNDFVPGSNTNADAVAFAALLEQYGADMLNVTGGWHETVVPQLTGEVPRAGFAYLAAAVRDAVSIPVAASNRISDPVDAEKILALGEGNLVSLGRALMADPDWPKKAEAGDEDIIRRRCVACTQGCLSKTFFAEPAGCLVNGYAGREYEHLQHRTAEPRNVLVLGAGVAGCEFAIQAALRGNNVAIWERSRILGGQLHLVAAPHAKHAFLTLIDYFRNMLARLSIPVVYSKDAARDDILQSGYDVVVFATGSTPKKLTLPDGCALPVVQAADIMSGKVIAGRNVVVIGGDCVGCECADYLAFESALSPDQTYFLLSQRAEETEKVLSLMDGARRNVAIMDAAKIGTGFEPGTAWPLMKELSRFGVKQYPDAVITGFSENSLTIEATVPKTREQKKRERETGVTEPEKRERFALPCDTVVSAIGSVPNDALHGSVKADFPITHKLGDAVSVGSIPAAIAQAIALAEAL